MKRTAKATFASVALFLLLGAHLPLAYADTELENTSLARIRNILNSLTPLINEAELQQDKSMRVQFRYEWLRSDINQIKQGIDQKLNTPSVQPRVIQPIKGDYLTLKSKQR